MFWNWLTRLRRWFASVFGPKLPYGSCRYTGTDECPTDKICDECSEHVSDGAPAVPNRKSARIEAAKNQPCGATGGNCCPVSGHEKCPTGDCPMNRRKIVPPQGGSGTAPPRRREVARSQNPDEPETVILYECEGDRVTPVTVPVYDRRENPDSTEPVGTATLHPDGTATVKADAGVDIQPGAITISDTFGRAAHAIHEAAASVPELPPSLPEAPAPHVPEPPPPSPPTSYDCGSSYDSGSSSSYDCGGSSSDSGSCGGGGDF